MRVNLANPLLFTILLFFGMTPSLGAQASLPASASQTVMSLTDLDASFGGGKSNEEEEREMTRKKLYIVDIDEIFYISLILDLIAVAAILLLVYLPKYRHTDMIFTYAMFNIAIFILTYVLNQVKISMGAAFGLFAVFSMLRYRTMGMNIKDMTYMFVFITIGLVTGIQLQYAELITILVLIFLACFILDKWNFSSMHKSCMVEVNDLELIGPEKRAELKDLIFQTTDIMPDQVDIEEIDIKRSKAKVKITYNSK